MNNGFPLIMFWSPISFLSLIDFTRLYVFRNAASNAAYLSSSLASFFIKPINSSKVFISKPDPGGAPFKKPAP